MYNYYFAIATESFLLDQEPLEEILRERTNYYNSSKKEIDFWFVPSAFFPNDIKKLLHDVNPSFSSSLAAIVSSDKQFIQWLKLRIVFVRIGNFQSSSIFIPS